MLIHKLTRELQHRTHQTVSTLHDLTLLQVQALLFVREQGSASMSALAHALGVSLPSATNLVDRLVEAKWLIRTEHPTDRRVIVVSVATAAKATLASLLTRKLTAFTELLAPLSQTEQHELARILEKIHTHQEEIHG